MADKEIGALTAVGTPLDGTELVHVVEGGNSRKATTQDIADLAISVFSGALVHKAADQTAANYSAGVVIPWDSESSGYDTDGYHDTVTNNTRITIPVTGKYQFTFNVEVSSVTASDYVRALLIKNGSVANFVGGGSSIVEISAAVGMNLNVCSSVIDCAATDYFEVWLDTESDTSITVTAAGSWFSVQRVE